MTSKPTPRASASVPSRAGPAIARDHRWLADRARNAMRHPLRIAGVAMAVFLASLAALVVYPQQQRRAVERLPELAERVDTVPLLAREATVTAELVAAEHTIDSIRAALAGLDRAEEAAASARSSRRGVRVTMRDSLTLLVAELSRLIDRAKSAPLLASYRNLAGARALTGDVRVRMLADSLVDIERRRESYGAGGGVDPVYVGLTAQAAAIGRTISDIAERRRVVLRNRLVTASSGLLADAPALAGSDSLRAALDTTVALAAVDSLRQAAAASARQVAVARATNARIMRIVAAARERANVAAPPLATLAATLALGAVLGMLASLLREAASPRLAGAAEVERALGVRVLGTLDAADVGHGGAHVPGIGIRTGEEAATRVARRLLSIGDACPRVAVIGDDAALVAAVVMALATSAAADARAVLLVDTDSANAPIQRRFRRRSDAGVTDVLTGSATWAETLIAHVGSHTLPIDLIPPGAPIPRAPATASVEDAGATLAQFTGSWDLVLFAVTSVDRPIMDVLLTQAGVRDAIMCAQVGVTELAALVAEHLSLQRRQVRHRGVVLVDTTEGHYPWDVAGESLVPAR